MFHKENPDYNRKQYGFYILADLVPDDHFLIQVDVANFSFIYDLVENTYSFDNDRHSLDLIMLIKIPLFQYFHIRSINH